MTCNAQNIGGFVCECGTIMFEQHTAEGERCFMCMNPECDHYGKQYRPPKVVLEQFPTDPRAT